MGQDVLPSKGAQIGDPFKFRCWRLGSEIPIGYGFDAVADTRLSSPVINRAPH
jgi:hypothetical protein